MPSLCCDLGATKRSTNCRVVSSCAYARDRVSLARVIGCDAIAERESYEFILPPSGEMQ